MGFIRKIKGSFVRLDSSEYVGEDTYLFYDIETGVIRRSDGTPGGAPISGGGGPGGGQVNTIVPGQDISVDSTDPVNPIVSAPTVSNKTEWQGAWESGTYNPNDIVLDAGWLAVALTTTTERPAPQSNGEPTYFLPEIVPWESPPSSTSNVVWTGHDVTITEDGWLRRLRVWVPQVTLTTHYHFVIVDITNLGAPIYQSIEEDKILPGEWNVVALRDSAFRAGTVLRIYIDAIDTSSSSSITGQWIGQGVSAGQPASDGRWNKDADEEAIRLRFIDANTGDREAELFSVVPNSTILFVDVSDPANFTKYLVTSLGRTNLSDSVEYYVQKLESGLADASGLNDVIISLPNTAIIEYEEAVDWWLTNPQPDWATIEGIKAFDGVFEVGVENNAYGIDLQFQKAYLNPHWDLMSNSSAGGSSTGDGGIRSVQSGTNVTVDSTDPANPIINVPVIGEINTSSNAGTGATLANIKVGTDLPFKSLTSDGSITYVTTDPDMIEINVNQSSIDHTMIANIGTKSHDQIDTDIGNLQTGKLDTGATAADSNLLQGQDGTFYRSRTNHTGIQTPDTVSFPNVGAIDMTTLDRFYRHSWSAGLTDGGVVTQSAACTADVSSSEITFRTDINDDDPLVAYLMPAVTGISVPINQTSVIYADYNAGTPIIVIGPAGGLNFRTEVPIAVVSCDGTNVKILSVAKANTDNITKMSRRFIEFGLAHVPGGTVLGEIGVQNISITAGKFYLNVNPTADDAYDTSTVDTFTYWYQDGVGGWTSVPSQTQISITQYDDGSGTLTDISGTRYSQSWVYINVHDNRSDIHVIYGTENIANVNTVIATSPPSILPPVLGILSALVGRCIVRHNVTAFHSVESAFLQDYLLGGVTLHNALAGLQGGVAGEYYHVTADDLIYFGTIPAQLAQKTEWTNTWVEGTEYVPNQIVRDRAWSMVANTVTTDRPGPVDTGAPYNLYNGTLIAQSTTARQLAYGIGIISTAYSYIESYKCYTYPDYLYIVTAIEDPSGINSQKLVDIFISTSEGPRVQEIFPYLVTPGFEYQIIISAHKINPAPTVFTGNWDYITPASPAGPLSGQIVHTGKKGQPMSINYIDNDAGDRTLALQGLNVGEVIKGAGRTWYIQSITLQTGYIDFLVTPEATGQPDGVQEFDFETRSLETLSYVADIDYWLANPNTYGLFGADVPVDSLVPDDNAYGVDVVLQDATFSTDYDLLAYSSVTGGSSATDKMHWAGTWSPDGPDGYLTNDVVYDAGWLMIANKNTAERASVQPNGSEEHLYYGTALLDTGASAKQLITGIEATADVGGYLNGYLVYTYIGVLYSGFIVIDPDGANIIQPVASFVGTSEGWRQFDMPPVIVGAGTKIQIFVTIHFDAPPTTTFNGNWDYDKLYNTSPAAPNAGEITHSNWNNSPLQISYTDNDAGDRTAELQGMTVGETIEGAGRLWIIQSIFDAGSYISFGISPAVQGGPQGVQNFVFETTTPAVIPYSEEVDYWLNNPDAFGTQGLYGVDVGYQDIVPDDNAYGLDLIIQAATIPVDWDLMSALNINTTNDTSGPSPVAIGIIEDEIDAIQAQSAILRGTNIDATAGITLDTLALADATEAKWMVQVRANGTPANRRSSEVHSMNDGLTLVDHTEYAILTLGSPIPGFLIDVTISGTDTLLRLTATGTIDYIVRRVAYTAF